MSSWGFKKTWRQWTDEARYSVFLRTWAARGLGWQALLSRRKSARLALLSRAVSLSDSVEAWKPLMKCLHREAKEADSSVWREALQVRSRLPSVIKNRPGLTRTVVLKAPQANGEKGVLLTYFEYNLARLLLMPQKDLLWLAERYDILFAASWCPTDYALLGLACASLPQGLWIQPANHQERERLSAFHPSLRCLPGLACDWVNPAFYRPKSWNERTVDILMVANWGTFKRHWDFFHALKALPHDLRVVLVGQNEGGFTQDDIKTLAAQIGVPQKLDIRQSLPIEAVTALQCDSKISTVVSRREGGCVALVESLFAGCALAVRSDACIGAAAHINERTGILLRPGKLAEGYQALLERGPLLDSAAWAGEQVSCHHTLRQIQLTLRSDAEEQGRPWTKDLALPHWRPHPVLACEQDRHTLKPAYTELHAQFPQVFPEDLMTSSAS
jgi:glycosyltransferase involved in cell wall biosynthesis